MALCLNHTDTEPPKLFVNCSDCGSHSELDWHAICEYTYVERPTTVAKERTMRQLQVEGAAVSELHIGRKLVGNWTLDLKPRVRNFLPSGPGGQSLKPIPLDSAARGRLILVWRVM
jgi:hypothetical protein